MDAQFANFNFQKNLENLFQLKVQIWSGDQPLQIKTFEHIRQSKSAFWHFQRLGLKTKKQIQTFQGFLIILLKNIAFPKFLECIGCISSYLPKSE